METSEYKFLVQKLMIWKYNIEILWGEPPCIRAWPGGPGPPSNF